MCPWLPKCTSEMPMRMSRCAVPLAHFTKARTKPRQQLIYVERKLQVVHKPLEGAPQGSTSSVHHDSVKEEAKQYPTLIMYAASLPLLPNCSSRRTASTNGATCQGCSSSTAVLPRTISAQVSNRHASTELSLPAPVPETRRSPAELMLSLGTYRTSDCESKPARSMGTACSGWLLLCTCA